ncbi:MAG: nucleoside triphosphate pyrophosphatase [Phycisphaerae bacterium]|jgi:septum formation protein
MNTPQKIVLASASPRRKELMEKAGYDFSVVVSDINESEQRFNNLAPSEYAKQLALAKALSVARKYPESVVIGADTIADFEGQIIGKPRDTEHAEQITRKLFSRPHKVITGLAVIHLKDNLRLVECDTTIVYPHKMTEEQLARHIEGGTWKDKAGAYAIQETGDEFVEKIDGSLTNVMGLPMELLAKMLDKILT